MVPTPRIVLIFVITALLSLASLGTAQTTKVGYVDVDRVTRKAKAVNAAMDSVQSDIEDLQKQIDEKRRQIKELQSELERKEGVLAASEQEKKQKEIQRLKNELDDLGYRAERKARELDATVFEPLMKRILFAIQDVAKEQKFDIILRGEAVLYGSSAADITDAVIEGELDHSVGDQIFHLSAGMSIFIPQAAEHDAANRGAETARMVVAYPTGARQAVMLEAGDDQ